MRTLYTIALVLAIVGALNWGLVALFGFDLVAAIFGMSFGQVSPGSAVIYGLVGLAGLFLALYPLAAPREHRVPAERTR